MSDIDSSSTTTDETRLLSHISEADEFTSEIDQTSEHGEHRGRLFSETAVAEEKSEVEAEETERFAEDNLAPGVGAAPQEFETEESKVPSQQDVGGSEEEIKPDLGDAREEIKPEPLGQETIHDSVAKPADEFVDPQEDSRADQQEGKPLTGPGGHEMSHYELFTSSSESIGTLVDAVKLRKCNPDQGLPLLSDKAIEALEALRELNKGTCLIYGNGVYEGGLKDRRPNGIGAASWPGGESYQGEWRNGVPGGYGKFSIKTRCSSFSGDWDEGLRSGHGILTESEFTYRGGFEAGLFSRFGRLSMKESGLFYVGWFREGKRHGIGTIMKADEAQGQVQRFRDDDLEQEPDQRLREGEFQTLHLGTQRVYSGQTLDGVPYGLGAEFGEMIAVPAPVQIEEAGVGPPKQAVYLGGFREGAKDGWGVDCLANGERFVGWCASGERSGMGVSESDKEQYRGEWDHGLRHGFGVCVYAAKNMVYAGFWRRGAKHGRGLWMVAEPSRLNPEIVVFLSKNGARLRENSDGGHPGRQKAEIEQMINEYDAVLKDALAQVKAAVTNASTVIQDGRLPSQAMLDTANQASNWAETLHFWPFPEPQKPASLRTKITSFFKPK